MKNEMTQWGIYVVLMAIGMVALFALIGDTAIVIKMVALAVGCIIIQAARWAKHNGWLPSHIANIEE